MKFNFKAAIEPAVDIAAITGGAIVSNQFLDFGKMFKTADPNGNLIKHQGGIKAGAAILALMFFGKKMPRWAKMGVVGVGVGGAIKEIKVLSGGKIESVGAGDNSGSDTSSLDRLLDEARRNSMQGADSSVGANDSGAGVGTTDAGAGVGYNAPDIPQMDYGTTVGWI